MIPRQRLRKRRLAIVAAGLVVCGVLALFGMRFTALAVLATVAFFAARRVGVPVMVYHAVSPDAAWLPWADNIAVRPKVFEAHMRHLARTGWQVVPSQALIDAQGAGALSAKSVVLHFDDAYLDFHTVARPVLERYELPATVFASSDFIDPSTGIRSTTPPRGYMNADELRAADASPLIEVACHGKDHARIATGPDTALRDPAVWDKETAWLWSLMPGDKSRWFETTPPAVPAVPQNDSSLCARLWTPGGLEGETARDTRVQADLTTARATLSALLDRDVTFLCWPFDRCDPAALANAKAAGFVATTGGTADNIPGTRPALLSRTHVNDFAAAGGPVWVEVLVFRAKLEVASGNLLFWPVTAVASLLRKRRFAILHGPRAGAVAAQGRLS